MKKVEWNKEFPISGYDRETSSFQLADGAYLQMYQIISKDLINSDADEIEMDCFQWAKFYKTYWRDMEIVSMMFPCNTSKQQEYWKERLRQNQNPLFTDMLNRNIEELIFREKHTNRKEFYLFLFAESKAELAEMEHLINSTLGLAKIRQAKMGLVKEIPEEKKLQILFKLANKNSKIF